MSATSSQGSAPPWPSSRWLRPTSCRASSSAAADADDGAERAAALVQHPGVEAYWSDYVILGYAFAQVWDMDSAGSYWEMAVQHAATPASLLNALRGSRP